MWLLQEVGAAAEDAERLIRLEQSLMVLWGRVEAGGRRAEQRHRELLRLYAGLQQLSSAERDGAEASLSALLDQQLSELRKQLDEERWQREEVRVCSTDTVQSAELKLAHSSSTTCQSNRPRPQ